MDSKERGEGAFATKRDKRRATVWKCLSLGRCCAVTLSASGRSTIEGGNGDRTRAWLETAVLRSFNSPRREAIWVSMCCFI